MDRILSSSNCSDLSPFFFPPENHPDATADSAALWW
jgi:hypothetical protein